MTNDETTKRALAQLAKLVIHHGGDLDHAAIAFLAEDLGYTVAELCELMGASRGRLGWDTFGNETLHGGEVS